MSVIDVIKACYDSIEQTKEHIDDAIVYLDAGCTESFQFTGAFPILVEHGARAVCSLENMSPLDVVANWKASSDPAKKIVIMTSCLLSDTHRYVLRCLSTHQNIHLCAIFTSISEAAHSGYHDSPLGPDAFHEYESLLLQDFEELINKSKKEHGSSAQSGMRENLNDDGEGWAELDEKDVSNPVSPPVAGVVYGDSATAEGNAENKFLVSVHHFPLILCPLSPKVFVLPSGGLVAEAFLSSKHEDSLSPALPSLSTGMGSNAEDTVPGAMLTAHFLYHMAAKMDLKLEIFSFGDLSNTVGRIMTDMSSLYDVGRRKRSAGLLLIDRTLDLLTPCCHGDSFFDRIFSALPHRDISAFPALSKGTQPQQKHKSASLRRAPLDVEIPVGNIVNNTDSRSDNFQLLESIEAALCGWNSDSKIQDLINLCSKENEAKSFDSSMKLLNGSFVSAEHFRGTPYLEAILDRRAKDGAILVKKWLQEALRKENIKTPVKPRAGSATRSELESLLKALVKSDSSLLRNKGIVQLAAAALVSLDENKAAKWDAFMSAEKMLNVCAGDTSQNLAAQVGDLINKSILAMSRDARSDSSQGLLSFEDALLLTSTGYILAGENFPTSGSSPFSWQEEHLLKEAIVDAIFENPAAANFKFLDGLIEELEKYRSKILSKEEEEPTDELLIDDFDDDQWGKWGEEDEDDGNSKEKGYDDVQLKLELRDRVDNLFKLFHKLSSLSTKNICLREASVVLESGFGDDSYKKKGLLYKLLKATLGRRDVPGLEHHSSAVGRLFKSGFGRFGLGQAKPTLADQNTIFVFVLGGINGLEVREALEALSESGRPEIELIVGGTTLLTPNDMVDLLLGESSFF
ncbi:hypothetical protein V2J09_012779 [Rumex salicifolius]